MRATPLFLAAAATADATAPLTRGSNAAGMMKLSEIGRAHV
jgi:hypothetical protein